MSYTVRNAITFDELVSHGRRTIAISTTGLGNAPETAMPQAFGYLGHPVTHENDDTYLVGADDRVTLRRGEVLIIDDEGKLHTCTAAEFKAACERDL